MAILVLAKLSQARTRDIGAIGYNRDSAAYVRGWRDSLRLEHFHYRSSATRFRSHRAAQSAIFHLILIVSRPHSHIKGKFVSNRLYVTEANKD